MTGYAQKSIHRFFPEQYIETIDLIGKAISEVKIETSSTDQIEIYVEVSGEHSEQMILQSAITQKVLSLGMAMSPLFTPFDDKLAAHKVMGINMFIKLPEKKNLLITAGNANVYLSGIYNEVALKIGTGNCVFSQFLGEGSVTVQNGDVLGTLKPQVQLVTNTKKSSLAYPLYVSSASGKIDLLQTN